MGTLTSDYYFSLPCESMTNEEFTTLETNMDLNLIVSKTKLKYIRTSTFNTKSDMRQLFPYQIRLLTLDQISKLTKQQTNSLSPHQMAQLTSTQVQKMNVAWITPTQISSMVSENVIIELLQPQIEALTAAQLEAIPATIIRKLNKTKITSLNNYFISDKYLKFSDTEEPSNYKKIFLFQVPLLKFAGEPKIPSKVLDLTPKQIGVITQQQLSDMSYNDIHSMSKDQLNEIILSTDYDSDRELYDNLDTFNNFIKVSDVYEDITKLPNLFNFHYSMLKLTDVSDLTKIPFDKYSLISNKQWATVVTQIQNYQNVDPKLLKRIDEASEIPVVNFNNTTDITKLNPFQMRFLSCDQIKNLTDTQSENISEDQLRWLTQEQVRDLSETTVVKLRTKIRVFSYDQMKMFPIQFCSSDQPSYLSLLQMSALSPEKINVLTAFALSQVFLGPKGGGNSQ